MMRTTRLLLARAAAVLALATIASPTDLWATGGTIAGNGTKASPYLLEDAADWATFSNSSNAATYWVSGVYVKMTADIGTAESPVTTMVGENGKNYQGIFDGGGHILTISIEKYADKLAPFRYVSGATIKLLKTTGTIRCTYSGYSNHSGLIAQCDGATIESCISDVAITWSDGSPSASSGGIVGTLYNTATTTIRNCAFTGSFSVTGSGTITNMAGIVGTRWNGTAIITNCLNAGTYPNGNLCKIARVNGNGTIANCYSTTDATSNGSNYDDRGTYTTATGADLVALLGSGWELSGGQPVPIMDEKNIGSATITGVNEYYLNDGTTHQPDPIVTDIKGDLLVKGTHYNVDWNGDGTTAGEYTVTVTGRGTYSGFATATYTVTDGLAVTSSTTTLEDGYFYKVSSDVTIGNRITVNGSAMLVLGEGATLTARYGITVNSGNTLTIQGSGTLTASSTGGNEATIGSYKSGTDAGTIIINSGTINASTTGSGAAIGGYYQGAAGTIIINGGVVNAVSNSGSAIGGGSYQYSSGTAGAGGSITINGGQVTATSTNGYGIGKGKNTADSSKDGADGTINLGWTNATDFIKSSSFAGTVTLDKTFFYEDGTTGVTLDNLASHAGEKIIPSTATTNGNLAYATISGVENTYLYTGSAIGITPSVKDFQGNTLTEGTHYTVSYTLGGVAATVQEQGTYTLTISAKDGGGYTNSRSQTFTVTDNLQSDGAGGYYVNMLKTGAKEVSLVEHNSTRVYDDGGSAAHFSRNADGTLLLTAAAGTVIRLTGTIDVAYDTQVLTVYDGATTSASTLGTFNADGDISVVSTGTQMLLRFVTSSSGTANGLNLTATAVSSASMVTLTDGEAITTLETYAGQLCDVTYSRSFTIGKASTVCLPFAYQNSGTAGTFYTFTGIEKKGSDYEATMTEYTGSTLVANTPYLFMPSATGAVEFSGAYTLPASITAGTTTSGDWTYVGTYTEQKWTEEPTGIYGFSAQAVGEDISQGQFVKVGAYVRVKPLRCYLQYKSGTENYAGARRHAPATADEQLPERINVRLVSATGEVTAIGTLHTTTGEVTIDAKGWYDLSGRRLSGKPTVRGIYVNNGKTYIIK